MTTISAGNSELVASLIAKAQEAGRSLISLHFENPLPHEGADKMLCGQNVATISAGNSELVGSLIAEALAAVGADGVLSIETGNSLETCVEVQEGMEVDRGFISPQFVTNHVRSWVQRSNVQQIGPSSCKLLGDSEWGCAWRWTQASWLLSSSLTMYFPWVSGCSACVRTPSGAQKCRS